MAKANVYQIVTDTIIEKLKEGVVPWRKSWISLNPKNLRGTAYRGINVFLLSMQGYNCPVWATWKQIQDKGGTVKADQTKKYTIVTFWKRLQVDKLDDSGDKTKKTIMFMRYYRVYNLEQTEGIEIPDYAKPNDNDPLVAAQAIIDNMPNTPKMQNGGRCAYCPPLDVITMPTIGMFDDSVSYYSSFFHELTHSTGHTDRLDRKEVQQSGIFGPIQDYSIEELVAELGSAMLAATAGIGQETIENSAAYIQGWLRKLQDDPKFVVQAAQRAQKAADYVLERSWDNSTDPADKQNETATT